MSVPDSVKRLLPHKVLLYRWEADIGYGKVRHADIPYAAPQCRIEGNVQSIRNVDERTSDVKQMVYLDDDYRVDVRDKVEMPDGETPNIMKVESFPGKAGDPSDGSYQVIWLS